MQAWSLSEGRLSTPFLAAGLDHPSPPLYPALVAGAGLLLSDGNDAAALVTVGFAGLSLLALFLLAKRLFDAEAGLFAAALAAVFPFWVIQACGASAAPLLLTLMALSMLWSWRMIEEKRAVFGFAAGIGLGLAFLTLTESLAFLPPLLLAPILLRREGSGFRFAGVRKGIGLCLAGFLLLAAPYAVYNLAEDGFWNLAWRRAFFTRWIEGIAGADRLMGTGTLSAQADALLPIELAAENSPVAFTLSHLPEFGERLLQEAMALLERIEAGRILPPLLATALVFLLIGFLTRRGDPSNRLPAHGFLLAWTAPALMLLWIFFGPTEEALAALSLSLLLWAGCGILTFRRTVGSLMDPRFRAYFHTGRGTGFWILLLLLLQPMGEIADLIHADETTPSLLAKEARFIRNQLKGKERKILMCFDPRAALESGNFWYRLPLDYAGRISTYAKSQRADFVVFQDPKCAGGERESAPRDSIEQMLTPFSKFDLDFIGQADPGTLRTGQDVLYRVANERKPPALEYQPNVILISIDTLRADHMSCYGYERRTSPAFDRLAALGARFENVISHAPKTATSHMTLFTSTCLDLHGVGQVAPLVPRFFLLSSNLTTITEVLKEKGYRTAAFTGGSQVAPGFGFERGFEVYDTSLGYELHEDSFSPVYQWLSGLKPEDRFFLFLHTYQVHAPYCPPPPFDTIYDPDYSGPISARVDEQALGGYGKKDAEHLMALYDGEIRYTSEVFKRFFETLGSNGLLGNEKTLLIFTSDHGEEFQEHAGWMHSKLYRETLHVPLFFYWPGVIPPDRVIPGQVRLLDVAPTLLDLLGIDPPPQMQGLSLKYPLLAGTPVNLSAFSEDSIHLEQHSLRAGGWMYYERENKQDELYPLNIDPRETRNLLQTPLLCEPLSGEADKIRNWIDEIEDYNRRLKSLFGISRTGLSDQRIEFELTDEQKQRLRELGYL